MIDETQGADWSTNPQSTAPTEAGASNTQHTDATGSTAEPVGYCQDCGRPLTETTIRRVGRGVFCEPCLQVRLGGKPGPTASGAVPPTAYSAPGSMPPIPGEPSPALAGLLGFIPGVGAMYNGQFAKGIAHIIIFTILTSLANHVSGAFGLLVAGWVFYQVFDAIHTARARRDGLPLPNTFGLNDIGERMGYGATPRPTGQPPVPPAPSQSWSAPPTPPPAATEPETVTTTPPRAAWQQTPASSVPPAAYANWAGYIPPTSFANPAPSSSPGAGYQETYTGTTPNWTGAVPPSDLPPSRQVPAAALWLIAFGILFLVANVVSWPFSIRWAAPVALWIFAAWSLYRRLDMSGRLRDRADAGGSPYLVSLLRVPVFLALLAILFTLQSLDLWTLGQTWPLLLIACGGFLILERAGGYNAVPPAASWPPQPPVVPPTSPTASSHESSSVGKEPR